MDHHDFVSGHATGSIAARIHALRASLMLEARDDLPLMLGEGYRWQRLNASGCFACGLLLLLGAPIWLCVVLTLLGIALRDWGLAVGALFATLVFWYGEYIAITGGLTLAIAPFYLWQSLRAAKGELVRLALAEPRTFQAALARGALTVEPAPAA